FLETHAGHGVPDLVAVFRVEHEKPAAPGADELAAERTVRASEVVPLIDERIAHVRRAPPLVLPMLVHELAEGAKVASLERLLAAPPKRPHVVAVLHHSAVLPDRPLVLVAEDPAGAARKPGKKQHRVVFEIEHRLHAERQRRRPPAVAPIKSEAGPPA